MFNKSVQSIISFPKTRESANLLIGFIWGILFIYIFFDPTAFSWFANVILGLLLLYSLLLFFSTRRKPTTKLTFKCLDCSHEFKMHTTEKGPNHIKAGSCNVDNCGCKKFVGE